MSPLHHDLHADVLLFQDNSWKYFYIYKYMTQRRWKIVSLFNVLDIKLQITNKNTE